MPNVTPDWLCGGLAAMAHSAFVSETPVPALESLPIRLQQSASRGSALSRLLLVLPAVLALSVPLGAIAINAAGDPASLALLAERPLATAQIATGLLLWVGLFVLPAQRALSRLWNRRTVEIADGMVQVEDRTVFGSSRWSMPIDAYLGLAHHIRASLSGLTHEIVLVHADSARTVTLLSADKVTQSTFDGAKLLLGLPEVPPRMLYQSEQSRRSAHNSGVLVTAGA